MLMMRKMMKRRKGFTLIELIVVIAILGILAAVAIPRFTGMRHEATVKAEGSTAASIISAARVSEAETGDAITTTAGIDDKYMVISGDDKTKYGIAKNGDELYEVTWKTAAGGDYATKSFTLTEGTEFKGEPNS